VKLTLSAPAKINLGLEILGRRPDGYHDIVTVLQTIDLTDRLTFDTADGVTLTCAGMSADESNLVARAARLLADHSGVRSGAAIHLDKAIPVAAGLGGGSSDAATTLLGLNELWGLKLTRDVLSGLARRLGADVPFFLRGGTQLAAGIGEVLAPLPTPALWVVLVVTSIDVPDKTRRLYGALGPGDLSSGAAVQEVVEAIRSGASLAGRKLPSGFARVVSTMAPGVGAAMSTVRAAGGVPSLCGAGPTVMSLHDQVGDAERVAAGVRTQGFRALVARTREAGDSAFEVDGPATGTLS